MHHDDKPIGRILSRREIMALFGTTGAAILAGCAVSQSGSTTPGASEAATAAESITGVEAATATPVPPADTAVPATTAPTATAEAAAVATELPTCVVSPEQTEGPYYADVQLDRSDIRTDTSTGAVSEGIPLMLTFAVSSVSSERCMPLEGAMVEIWHCDARGVYSAFAREGTDGQNFLRGHQTTGSDGTVHFTSIYPGWYPGRTIHIHFKVHTTGSDGVGYEFTSQMYFDDTISDMVLAQAPYSSHTGLRSTTNTSDGIYRNDGNELMLALTQSGDGSYTGFLHIGLDLSNTSV